MTEPSTIDGEAEEILEGAIQAAGAVAVRERGTAIVARDEISVEDLVAQNQKIHEAMSAAMREDHHYGKIPGVSKPTLLKPGAEKLCVLFRLAPSYQSERIFHDDGHLTVIATCTLTHIPTGLVVSAGEALCTSRETRYAYRNQKRSCPNCGAEAIIKGKEEYGGGWVCWKKEGGCGTNFSDGDPAIEGQEQGKIDNPDLADTFNTVLKMADKRALVAAVLNGTAASDVFTQDAEDLKDSAPGSDQPSGSGATGAERASAAGAEHTASVDPGLVLPDGFKGDDVMARVGETLKAVDSTVDWRATWDAAILALYGKERTTLTPDEVQEVFTRLAVVADRLHPFTQTLPPTDAEIAEAFAYAFQSVQITVVQAPVATQSDAGADGQGAGTPEAQKGNEAALSPQEQAQLAAAVDDDIPF